MSHGGSELAPAVPTARSADRPRNHHDLGRWRRSSVSQTFRRQDLPTAEGKTPRIATEPSRSNSAYPVNLTHNIYVPAYKSNMLGTGIEEFITRVAYARVVNEHTIGVFKGLDGAR
ncbi:hypothetical protein GQ600_3961 [Phytophthora cactorum]|nr:hypothetical protein GQ600_3961 [Phytophthora cactorum]